MILSSLFFKEIVRMAQEAMDVCFPVLKESNKTRFDSFESQEKCVDHIPYYLSGLSHALFLQNKWYHVNPFAP